MEPLAFPFSRDRFSHHLLERVGNTCLVKRTNDLTGSVHYEVVVLHLERPYGSPPGTPPDHEAYPPSSKWGETGWTYTSLDEARARMAEFASGESRRAPQEAG